MGKVMEKWARRVMFPEKEDELAKLRWEKKTVVLNTWAMCSYQSQSKLSHVAEAPPL